MVVFYYCNCFSSEEKLFLIIDFFLSIISRHTAFKGFKGGQKYSIFLLEFEGCMCSVKSIHFLNLSNIFLLKFAVYDPFYKLFGIAKQRSLVTKLTKLHALHPT